MQKLLNPKYLTSGTAKFERFRRIPHHRRKNENSRNMRAYFRAKTLYPSVLEGKIPCLQKVGF